MSNQNFIDHVKIQFKSGNGGKGSTHFYRAKYIPKGGPDGGDGGRGGHIILRGDKNKWTLLHLKYRKHIKAEHGGDGTGNHKFGASGSDVIIDVPLGTVAKDVESGKTLFEINYDQEEVILLSGGRGGLGNSHFKTSTNQSPQYAQPGERGQEAWITLELKLLADVGLVGYPNAGKSTLLSSISAAKPKIGAYPFTTLVPSLGIVSYRDDQSFVMADIPGIIEGAHAGKGLGHQFLRHIERNSVLLFVIPCDTDDIKQEYKILSDELAKYNPELVDKPRIVGISKVDLIDDELVEEMKAELPVGVPYVFFSSISQQGIPLLKDLIWQNINTKTE